MITVAGAILTPERIAALAALIVSTASFRSGRRADRTRFCDGNGARTSTLSHRAMLVDAMDAGGNSFRAVTGGASSGGATFLCGRYDAALPLLPWSGAAGALRFVEVVPRGFAFYLAPTASRCNGFAAVQSVVAIGGILRSW